jgi:hypothetical protein
VSLSTFLADRFEEAERLSVLATDQMLIRAAGTVSMLLVPLYVQVVPRTAFAVTGLALTLYAATVLAWARRCEAQPDLAASEAA